MRVGHGVGGPVQRHHRHRLQKGSSIGQRCTSDTYCIVLTSVALAPHLHHGVARLPPRLHKASSGASRQPVGRTHRCRAHGPAKRFARQPPMLPRPPVTVAAPAAVRLSPWGPLHCRAATPGSTSSRNPPPTRVPGEDLDGHSAKQPVCPPAPRPLQGGCYPRVTVLDRPPLPSTALHHPPLFSTAAALTSPLVTLCSNTESPHTARNSSLLSPAATRSRSCQWWIVVWQSGARGTSHMASTRVLGIYWDITTNISQGHHEHSRVFWSVVGKGLLVCVPTAVARSMLGGGSQLQLDGG